MRGRRLLPVAAKSMVAVLSAFIIAGLIRSFYFGCSAHSSTDQLVKYLEQRIGLLELQNAAGLAVKHQVNIPPSTRQAPVSGILPSTEAKDLNIPAISQKFQQMYSTYHQSRRDNCDGCRYIPFYEYMWSGYQYVFDAGSANCGVMRMLKQRGKTVQGIEFNQWIVDNYCKDFNTTGQLEVGPLHSTKSETDKFDLVLCTDVLEHVPLENVEESVATLARLTKPGGHLFLVIAHDPSKHENHAERSNVAQAGLNNDIKVHETVQPRAWWIEILQRHGLIEDQTAGKMFLELNERQVKDPRYGYTSAKGKYYPPNERHVQRLYFLRKTVH
mmetsp:Transcript_29560/g.49699  ORF Transcript_29560/g.49699 Transcript_29560/m.49699 type:complete len:329 (-) Transcript_29560:1379-2365(-)